MELKTRKAYSPEFPVYGYFRNTIVTYSTLGVLYLIKYNISTIFSNFANGTNRQCIVTYQAVYFAIH
jgi:hypothetical protein